MKYIFLYITVLASLMVSSQEVSSDEEVLKLLGGQQVFINKEVIAFSVHTVRKKNGVESTNTNSPNLKNPFKIFISSDEKSASIRINNKNLPEDIFLKFKKIYKIQKSENEDDYRFLGDNNCMTSFIKPKKGNRDNQTLFISCGDEKDGYQMILTISKYNQL